MQHPPAVPLQVDAFGGGIGRDEDAHRRAAWVRLKFVLRALAIVGVHAAV